MNGRSLRAALVAILLSAALIAADVPQTPADLIIAPPVDSAPADERRVLVGSTEAVNATLDLSGVNESNLTPVPRMLSLGRIQRTESGFRWTATVESPGAAALRIHFSNLFLPNNATLTLAGAGDSFSYTGRGPLQSGEFWSNTVSGDRATMQIDYSGRDIGRVLQAIRLTVAEIGPLSSKFPVSNPEAGEQLCSFNADCVENASCVNLPSAVADAQKAVAMILFVSGAFQYICSGGLVDDNDASSAIPYFLTANHCLSKSSEANSLEAYFAYTTACGTCDTTISDKPRTLGSTITATNSTSDYTLLRLSQPAPAGTAFLKTNNTPVANSNGLALYRISHPGGAPQAYSAHAVDTSRPTCRTWPRGNWIYSSDTFGATEGGSSGSPVVNAAGEVVGQLSGACGYNVNDSCDSASNATVDGALAAYWSQVEPYLGGGGSCIDADGDGVCASEDCDDNDASVYPGAPEICDDGKDNNCNGLIDGEDPACQTGGCDLLPVGAGCTDDNECCSSKCRGKPGAKVCK
jgi:V8-like Glu-specific endopeptidase